MAALRAYDAAVRTTEPRETKLILEQVTFVAQVRDAPGELLFTAAVRPSDEDDSDSANEGRRQKAPLHFGPPDGLSNACSTARDASAFDSGCTFTLFAERALPGGAVHVACAVPPMPAAYQVKRRTDDNEVEVKTFNGAARCR
jgi:hypothetical protein